MLYLNSIFLLPLLVLSVGAKLRNANVEQTARAPMAAKGHKATIEAAQTNLEKASDGLAVMASPLGSSAKSKMAKSLQACLGQLKTALKESNNSSDAKTLDRLLDEQKDAHSFIENTNVQHSHLMKGREEQEQDLLSGILLTCQNKSMVEQIGSNGLEHLAVVLSVLTQKHMETPLFQHAAAFLDGHVTTPINRTEASIAAQPTESDAMSGILDNLKVGKHGKPDMSPIISALEFRLHHMEVSERQHAAFHLEKMKKLDTAMKKEGPGPKRILRKMTESRNYLKAEGIVKSNINSLKSAITAIETGDMGALAESEAALQGSMKTMQARTGDFLHLIQLTGIGGECPYCVAQCVDKCHTAGAPYVQCLTDCTDVGK
eukprot:gnl/TRDRNA2_/TRDRNA2_37696_c1_seq1.p1 gnl/TRDRNA2_/TRDRNA2_37696_c1~~gnl/TRDRNA2_/TRDRNA2_37696_c1_seq1.p1  ORF type:complete len:375 (+),score=89.08 gnl/TRDRNA2_/TRDRNA2_37696_c1_seq1:53-1177(+)